jgi:hypothetical protein
MNRTARLAIFLEFFLVFAILSNSNAAELDQHLEFFAPLFGPTWQGGFIGENAPDMVIVLKFEPILNGMAVKYSREAAEIDFFMETHFYWDPSRGEVRFISLNSRGIVNEGTARLIDGSIVLVGYSHHLDKTTEYRTEFEIDSNGVLRDTFTRKQDGAWVSGHTQEYIIKE